MLGVFSISAYYGTLQEFISSSNLNGPAVIKKKKDTVMSEFIWIFVESPNKTSVGS